MKKSILRVVFIIHSTFYIIHSCFGQEKGYFQFPIYPGKKGTLAGAIGDLRTNHFHAGIDVRTGGQEGLPVGAAAAGYVSKIKIQSGGYGNVLFIKHPNGLTTVYGHLQKFNDQIAAYTRKNQYKNKAFEIELNPEPNAFPVQKGEIIALSGNSGGSQGPHLHFEIRDAKDNFLNPLFYGFDEIQDDIAPVFQSLALRPMNIDSRINGEFERISTRPIRQKDGNYVLSQPISVWGKVGLELMAFDYMNGVQFRNGVNCVEIKIDGKEIFAYNMTSFPNWTTRDYNYLIDYATEQKVGVRYLKCYNPDLNKFNLYKTDNFKGIVSIQDTLLHQVEVTLFDSYENASVLNFELKGTAPQNFQRDVEAPISEPIYLKSEVVDNVLKIKAITSLGFTADALLFSGSRTLNIKPNYVTKNETTFLYDLKSKLPDSVQIGTKKLVFNFKKQVIPNKNETYRENGYQIKFNNESLFDTLYLEVQKFPNSLKINDETIPLRDVISINFKPESAIQYPEKTQAYLNDNGRLKFLGGKWQNDKIEFTSRELGTYVLAIDSTQPNISVRQSTKKRIEARISDNLSGLNTFNAYVNDKWVLMNFDYKRALIWSEKEIDSTDFEGELRLEVTDRAGNIAILRTEIKEPVITIKLKPKNAKSRRKSPVVRGQRPKRKRH